MQEKTAYLRVGLIGAGEMGSGVGGWLAAHGVDVRTTLAGRSAASAERIGRAGIGVVDDLAAVARSCSLVLSIVPPDQALRVAEGFAAAYAGGTASPLYVDCNAVAPETVRTIAGVITAAGIRFVDAGIIGGAPREGRDGPHVYACGADVAEFERLTAYGLAVRPLDGPIGTASALKMCYGGLTKGITGIGAAMFACAEHGGVSEALEKEFSTSQPALHAWLTRQIPTMYPKAYRWVGEMREIALFGSPEPGVPVMYEGLAQRYAAIAAAQTVKGKA
jgi:3-hydroxyisobutyrate dehydrogenase-like beta-hydroxyacid dehydrogenase